MKKLMLSAIVLFGLLFVSGLVYSQEKQTTGKVLNIITKEAVAGVKVLEVKHGNTSFTDSTGHFSVTLPKRSRKLLFTHDEYISFRHKFPPATPHKNLKILLTPTNHNISDTLWRRQKNAISFSTMELISGAVAVRYERFLKEKHSVGLHTSVYLYGYNNFIFDLGNNPANFKGIKLAPFYRFYPARSNSQGLFLEGKIPFGYFNFSRLTYSYEHQSYTKNFPQQFRTVGGAVAIGWMFRLGSTRHGVGNFSIGLQVFPMDVPTEMEGELGGGVVTYTLNNAWWYITGPGSILEFKFTLGGIF